MKKTTKHIKRTRDSLAEWAFQLPPRGTIRVSMLVSFPTSAPDLGRKVHVQQLYALDFLHDADPAALASVLAEPILVALKEWEKANEQSDS